MTGGLGYAARLPVARPPRVVTQADLAFGLLQGAAAAAYAAQWLIDAGLVNLVAATTILVASTVTLQYLRLTRAFEDAPVSSFALLGASVTTQWGALMAQSLAWTPVSASLNDPEATFARLAAFQAAAIAGQALVRAFAPAQSLRGLIASRLLQRLGVFSRPTPAALWLLGALGAGALLVAGAPTVDADVHALSLTTNIAHGVRFLAWAPFLIPVLHPVQRPAVRRHAVLVFGLYMPAMVALGMVMNMRAVMFVGAITILLAWLLQVLVRPRPAAPRRLLRWAPLLLVAPLALAWAADIATASVVARAQRGHLGPLGMLQETAAALADERVLAAYREAERLSRQTGVYDEYYIANPAVARFVETKFHDNMFARTDRLKPEDVAALRADAVDRIAGILPDPLLNLLGWGVDKSVYNYSMGDYLDHLRYGAELGGFKTGSLFAHLLGLFGSAGYLVYLGAAAVGCLLWDTLARRDGEGRMQVAPIALLLAWTLFQGGLVAESLGNLVLTLLRQTSQAIVIYALALAVIRRLPGPFGGPAAHDAEPAIRAEDPPSAPLRPKEEP